jgi:hypothetical protein
MPKILYRWQEDEVTKLKSLAQKYPTATIARQLSRSAAAIIAKAQELNISLKVARPASPNPHDTHQPRERRKLQR